MENIKVLVCDDEPGMRMILGRIVEKAAGFEQVGEAEDGKTAVALFVKFRPDVVFLDVEMPRQSGIECARQIADMAPETCIIFATAHEHYMKEAFEVYAFDYLVKPFKVERVNETLARIASLRSRKEEEKEQPLRTTERRQMGLQKLLVKHKEGISLLDMADIILIQREDRATAIYTAHERIVTSEPLSELMERLDPNLFFRSHKSYLINLAMVYKIYPYGRWTYVVKLKDIKQDALITYEKYNELEGFFGSH